MFKARLSEQGGVSEIGLRTFGKYDAEALEAHKQSVGVFLSLILLTFLFANP